MKKANTLRILNQIEEQQKENLPIPSDNQETIPAAITDGVNGCIKEATILTIFENYGIFLIKEQEKPVDEALAEIEKMISIVYERGDVSVSALKHISEYLNNYKVDTRLRLDEKAKAEFFDHVLIEEMGEILRDSNTETSDCKEFAELALLEEKLNNAKCALISRYRVYVEKCCNEFISSYKNLFNNEFLEKFER